MTDCGERGLLPALAILFVPLPLALPRIYFRADNCAAPGPALCDTAQIVTHRGGRQS
jgi:hypothetical protein